MKHLVDFETFSSNSVNESKKVEKETVEEITSRLLEEIEVNFTFTDVKLMAEALKKVAEGLESAELNEGWKDILEKLKGIRRFNLGKFKPSKEAIEVAKSHPSIMKTVTPILTKTGVPKNLWDKAVLAVSDFFDGYVPMFDRIDIEYDAATETLKVKQKKSDVVAVFGKRFNSPPITIDKTKHSVSVHQHQLYASKPFVYAMSVFTKSGNIEVFTADNAKSLQELQDKYNEKFNVAYKL